jgi:hypothetical protein
VQFFEIGLDGSTKLNHIQYNEVAKHVVDKLESRHAEKKGIEKLVEQAA